MSKSIEERLFDAHKASTELRRLFDAYAHPMNDFWGLLNALGSIQKEFGPGRWIEHVNDVMTAMEIHDAGMFPDRWLEELDGGEE